MVDQLVLAAEVVEHTRLGDIGVVRDVLNRGGDDSVLGQNAEGQPPGSAAYETQREGTEAD